jgi:TRAP-type transport system periplasmic protein
MTRTQKIRAAITAAAVLVCAGCAEASTDKSGGSGGSQVLVMASNDVLLSAPAVNHFVEQVATLSEGRLSVRVEPDWKAADNEGRLISDVGAGEADLGWAGTRAFDTVGIDAFRPLHAPFLINSYAAEVAVVQDPMGVELLNSLQPKGLTGLALAADELRIPAAADGPLLSPSDFKGKLIRTVASEAQADGLKALGAKPTSEPPTEGELDGQEIMWWAYEAQGLYGSLPFITQNAVLWPRTVAIFANSKKLAALDEESQSLIRQAAAEATSWSTIHASDQESKEIAHVCQYGARIATATPDQLSALRQAAEPLYATLRNDVAQAKTLSRIESLVESAEPQKLTPLPEGCAYQPGDEKRLATATKPLSGPGQTGDLPHGTYRYTISRESLLDAGLDEQNADLNAGVWTWTFRSGRWSYEVKAADGHTFGTSCEGYYDVNADVVAFTTLTKLDGGDCAPPTWSARYSARTRTLIWSALNVFDFVPQFSAPTWERID